MYHEFNFVGDSEWKDIFLHLLFSYLHSKYFRLYIYIA